MKIDGQCHCGAIAFEAEVEPDSVSICHCTDCQTISGSPFRATVRAPADRFRLLRGTPTQYLKTAESGNKRLHTFCGACGTPIYACAPESPDNYGLRVGTISQRAQFLPRRQAWYRSALPWLALIPEAPASDKA